MAATGFLISVFCLRFGFNFIYGDSAVPKGWKKLTGKVIETDDNSFTIEYGDRTCCHVCTFTKEDFFATMGFSPNAKLNYSMASWASRERLTLDDLLGKGYSTDYYFRFYPDKKMYVWTDPENTGNIYRIWGDDKPARRSAGRAFITIGAFLLLCTLLTVKSKLTSL